MRTFVFALLICALVASVAAAKERIKSNINIELFDGSNQYWIAVAVQNANVDTSSVQISDANGDWQAMTYTDGWGYWTFSSLQKVDFPLSFRLTSVNGDQVTVNKAIRSLNAAVVDTKVQYPVSSATSSPDSDPTAAATSKGKHHTPTTAPTSKASDKHTEAPTKKATEAPKKATDAPTKKATDAPTKKATDSPTSAPSKATKAPTAAPTKKATSAPTTVAPTKKGSATTTAPSKTTAPSSSTGCSAPIKLLVPLYTYPGSSWDTVAASGSVVPTVAIINPNSGPGNGPDSSYNTYMAKLNAAGVEMIGYVHTSYGTRDITTVKSEIDQYASEFPLVVGIFLDEAAATADQVAYYQELYTYIMSFPGWKYDVINPGTVPSSGYVNVATQIVSYEDTTSKFAASANPSFASCSDKNQYAMITYAASSSSSMQSAISAAVSKGYYGWVYVTNGAAGGSTYNTLSSYYAAMATYVASLN